MKINKCILCVILLFFLSNCTSRDYDLIKSNKKIIKAEVKISNQKMQRQIIITNANQLDSLSLSLQQAKEINVQQGGAFETWADIKIYKDNRTAKFMVLFSKYNGWYLDVDNETLRCDYLVHLIKQNEN